MTLFQLGLVIAGVVISLAIAWHEWTNFIDRIMRDRINEINARRAAKRRAALKDVAR